MPVLSHKVGYLGEVKWTARMLTPHGGVSLCYVDNDGNAVVQNIGTADNKGLWEVITYDNPPITSWYVIDSISGRASTLRTVNTIEMSGADLETVGSSDTDSPQTGNSYSPVVDAINDIGNNWKSVYNKPKSGTQQ
jgi:hypothetical protein